MSFFLGAEPRTHLKWKRRNQRFQRVELYVFNEKSSYVFNELFDKELEMEFLWRIKLLTRGRTGEGAFLKAGEDVTGSTVALGWPILDIPLVYPDLTLGLRLNR